jgi:DNA polymerase III epsilon subunit-like protein
MPTTQALELVMMNIDQSYLALDLELNQPSRKVIQVGIAIAYPKQLQSQYWTRQWLLDPDEPIAPAITSLTGITNADIQTRAVAWELMASELSALIVTHNTFINPVTWGGADSAELLAALKDRGIAFRHFGRRWIDIKTCHVMLMLAHGKSHVGGLRSVMGRHGVSFKGAAHRADIDAANTLRLFFKLLVQHANAELTAQPAKAP